MRKIEIIDITLRESERATGSSLSFKEKLEIAKLLEKLQVDGIETGFVSTAPADSVLVRTIADTIQDAVVCVPVDLDQQAIDRAWAALQQAKKPRLNLIVQTSAVQMEYTYQMKPATVIEKIRTLVAHCVSLCPQVEFTAEDATRSQPDFLAQAISAAVESGARRVTLVDSSSTMLPEEMVDFINAQKQALPAASDCVFAFHCKDELGLATACALSALRSGVDALKTTFNGMGSNLSLAQLLHALQLRGESLDAAFRVDTRALQHTCKQLEFLVGARPNRSAFNHVVASTPPWEALTAEADILAVRRRVAELGYDLQDRDMERVFEQFRRLAGKKQVDDRDIEAIVAEISQQVAPTYLLVNYVINSGNAITATAFVRVEKQGEKVESVSTGDGPIDAAFLAIEQMLGHRFELEDFQIQSVTEGREAIGDALVKLRHNGKLYSGRGLSTDVIGASIRAYLNAVNKIVYEEKIK